MGAVLSASSDSTLAQYSERFNISSHPLYSGQHIKLLHEKLTSNIFILWIKQQYNKLINQKLALKPTTITQIQHYFQSTDSNVCSQLYKIYVLFGVKQMITLKQHILVQKLAKRTFNYKKLNQGLDCLLLAVSYLKYLNQAHTNINSTTIFVDDQKFLLADPWICPQHYCEMYPSPQKLNKINSFVQDFDKYSNDIFAIGMTLLQTLTQSNIRQVYKANHKIDIKKLQAIFSEIQSKNKHSSNAKQIFQSQVLMKKLRIILFKQEKQRLKMLQNIKILEALSKQQKQQRIQTKGIKKTLNKLRNLSEAHQTELDLSKGINQKDKSQILRKNICQKPNINSHLLDFTAQHAIFGYKQRQNIKIEKVNFKRIDDKYIRVSQRNDYIRQERQQFGGDNRDRQFGDSRDSQATVKITKQYDKSYSLNDQKHLKKVGSAQSLNILVNPKSNIQKTKAIPNFMQKQIDNRSIPKVNFNLKNYNYSTNYSLPTKQNHSEQNNYQTNWTNNNNNLNSVKYQQIGEFRPQINIYNFKNNQSQNKISQNSNGKFPLNNNSSYNHSSVPFDNSSFVYNLTTDSNDKKYQFFNDKNENNNLQSTYNSNYRGDYRQRADNKNQHDRSPSYLQNYLLTRQKSKQSIKTILGTQNYKKDVSNSPLQQKNKAEDSIEQTNNRNIEQTNNRNIEQTNNRNNLFVKSQMGKCIPVYQASKFDLNQVKYTCQKQQTPSITQKCQNSSSFGQNKQSYKYNPVNKKSTWKSSLKESLNSSNILLEGIPTTESIIHPFNMESSLDIKGTNIPIKNLSKFNKMYQQSIRFSQTIPEQIQNSQQNISSAKIGSQLLSSQKYGNNTQQLISNYHKEKTNQQNDNFNRRQTANISQFSQKVDLIIPQVQRKIIISNTKNKIYRQYENNDYSVNVNSFDKKSQHSQNQIKLSLSPQSLNSRESSESKTSKNGLYSKLQYIQDKFTETIGSAFSKFNHHTKGLTQQSNPSESGRSSYQKFATNIKSSNQKSQYNNNNSNSINKSKSASSNNQQVISKKNNDQYNIYFESQSPFPKIVNGEDQKISYLNQKQVSLLNQEQISGLQRAKWKSQSNKSESVKSQNITAIIKLKSNQEDDNVKQHDQISICSQRKAGSQNNQIQQQQIKEELTKSEKFISYDQKQEMPVQKSLKKQSSSSSNKKKQQIKIQEEEILSAHGQNAPFQIQNYLDPIQTQNKIGLISPHQYSNINEQIYSTPNKLEYSNLHQLISRTIPQEQEEGSLNGSFYNQVTEQMGEYVQEFYQNGGQYSGFMYNSMRNGPGKFYYREGGYYDGLWKNNMMNGQGKLYYDNGKLAYEGQWYKDQFHGRGKVYNDDAEQLLQPFDYHNFQNIEQYWQFYEGQLSHDTKVGYGKIKLSNGQFFSGTFVNDKAHGLGRFWTKDGSIVKGVWHEGKLVKQISRQRKSHFQFSQIDQNQKFLDSSNGNISLKIQDREESIINQENDVSGSEVYTQYLE